MKRHAFPVRKVSLAIASLVSAAAMLTLASPKLAGVNDVGLYRDIASRVDAVHQGTRASIDSEYPPLATALFWGASRMPGEFNVAWASSIFAVLALAVAYVAWRGRETDAPLLVAAVAIGAYLLSDDLAFGRLDVFVSVPLVLTWVSYREKRFAESVFFLTVAAMLKAVPVLLLPLLFLAAPEGSGFRVARGFLLACAVTLAVPLAILGPGPFAGNVSHFLRYHGERGVQHESVLSNVDVAWRWLHGSKANIVTLHSTLENASVAPPLVLAAKILALCFVVAVLFAVWRKVLSGKQVPFDTGVIAMLLGLLCLTPVLSPQYFMWVIPLLCFWSAERSREPTERGRAAWAFVATLVLGFLTYHVYKASIEKGTAPLVALHTVRSVVLVAMSVAFFLLFARDGRAKRRRARWTGVWIAAATIASVAVFVACFVGSRPVASEVSYARTLGGERIAGALPLFLDSNGPDIYVTVKMRLQAVHPVMFRVKPDDCIRSLSVNGVPVDAALVAFCDYGMGRDVDLGKYLRRGENTFEFDIHDEGGGKGGVTISAGRSDPLVVAVRLSFPVLLAWLAYLALRLKRTRANAEFWVPVAVGTIVRVLYSVAFDYNARGHDTDGHIEYIRYVADNLRLPAAQAGWEFHQAPLYYALAASWMKLVRFLGFPDAVALSNIQFFSFVCSVASVVLAAWIMRMLFPKKSERTFAIVAGVMAVSLPSFVFLSTRITNDVLYQPLALAVFAFLLRWWKRGDAADWYAAAALFSVSLIVKISALAFAPVMLFAFFLRPGPRRWRNKLRLAALSSLMAVAIAGWYPTMRLFEPDTGKTLSLGNDGMSSDLAVEDSVSNFLTFNPAMVLRTPYNDPWSDSSRRSKYWEYLYRSAFFGEFGFDAALKDLSRAMLLFGFAAVICAAYGMFKDGVTRHAPSLPPALVLAALLASSVAYRLSFPFAPNQDFRFIVVAIVPLAYFSARGAMLATFRSGIAVASISALAACCVAFDVALYAAG